MLALSDLCILHTDMLALYDECVLHTNMFALSIWFMYIPYIYDCFTYMMYVDSVQIYVCFIYITYVYSKQIC